MPIIIIFSTYVGSRLVADTSFVCQLLLFFRRPECYIKKKFAISRYLIPIRINCWQRCLYHLCTIVHIQYISTIIVALTRARELKKKRNQVAHHGLRCLRRLRHRCVMVDTGYQVGGIRRAVSEYALITNYLVYCVRSDYTQMVEHDAAVFFG